MQGSSVRRLLIVEDNDDTAHVLKWGLEQLGYEVEIAHNGPLALRVATQFHPQVAVLDIGLPVMDGYELGRRLRELSNPPRLIAVTGYGASSDREKSLEAGFEQHLVKPIELTAVQDALAKI